MSELFEDMVDDEVEERRARWTFNLVVFFLVFAFAIDLGYMTSSILPVGIGLLLIAWRVWRTPEITNPISSRLGLRLSRLVQPLAIALVVAPILLGLSAYPTANPNEITRGFPVSVTYSLPDCFGPGGARQCLAYDPLGVALDYLFWMALAFGVVVLAHRVRTHEISR